MFRPATGPALAAAEGGDHLVDPLLTDARRVVLEYRRPSISVIQRHLRIGYNRAASLLESLEQFGLVTAMRPDGTREVVYPL